MMQTIAATEDFEELEQWDIGNAFLHAEIGDYNNPTDLISEHDDFINTMKIFSTSSK